jgi:hypothetical protein
MTFKKSAGETCVAFPERSGGAAGGCGAHLTRDHRHTHAHNDLVVNLVFPSRICLGVAPFAKRTRVPLWALEAKRGRVASDDDQHRCHMGCQAFTISGSVLQATR